MKGNYPLTFFVPLLLMAACGWEAKRPSDVQAIKKALAAWDRAKGDRHDMHHLGD